MTFYKCGHNRSLVFVQKNDFTQVSRYHNWIITVGFDGTREKCFDCYSKEARE